MPKIVLIADDNPHIRKQLCKMFAAEADYHLCAEATNGQEAIALAIQHRPDLIILDMTMPVMSGLEAAKELKRLMPSVPIILFTQHGGLAAQFPHIDRVVSKSFGHTLISHVRELAPAS